LSCLASIPPFDALVLLLLLLLMAVAVPRALHVHVVVCEGCMLQLFFVAPLISPPFAASAVALPLSPFPVSARPTFTSMAPSPNFAVPADIVPHLSDIDFTAALRAPTPHAAPYTHKRRLQPR
jgi:hypothetical protein